MTGVEVHLAPWVVPVLGEPIRAGAVAVRGERILAVGPRAEVLAETGGAEQVHEWPGVIVPGLVNAHSHLQYTCMSTVGAGRYLGFEDWSRAFQVVYEQPHDWRASAADGLAIAVSTGTTAIADIVTDLDALDVLEAGRVHGIAYWELMSLLEDDWRGSGRAITAELVRTSGVARIGLSPHAPYSLDTPVLSDLTGLSQELGVRRHLHLAESAWEAEYTMHGRGDLAEQWRLWGYDGFHLLRNGGSALRPVAYAETIGALGEDVHIAHGIYVDAEDRATLRRAGTSVALCPRSNAVIGLDEAPVADYLREGNAISVGTDSLSSTPSLDLLGDVAELHRIARAQGYTARDLHARLLHAATLGGAIAMGSADSFGALTAGSLADLAVLDLGGSTAHDVVAAIVESGEGSALATIISGEVRWTRS
ncbi:cytosine/adenosine deaminase-related metal-dependent hydrolase [Rathayibacter tanaceti]|uniref:Amidohydrolase family protein n=2 Tax=Rathayibacter tanaceti TaxID=1671680 RepID=A0A162J2G8_9MICO|nr:Atrazine chlorohydrolase [Rathayibacter tanaceti]QHC57129.1 amidohydrolase family protein [Rathayibacter tanaceti]TCO37837.1 cytosine/adenosine deaminase-related metal-dependent hydrolase [Rathayibacter tanaceti]